MSKIFLDVIIANGFDKNALKILKQKTGKYLIYGKGLGSLSAKNNTKLNFGNSGTLARLLIGILATTPNISLSTSIFCQNQTIMSTHYL